VGVVVVGTGAAPAEIDQLGGAGLGAQADKELILEGGPAVIGRKGNAHRQSGLAGTGLAPELPVALIGWPRPNPAGWWPGSSVGIRPWSPSRTTSPPTPATCSMGNPKRP